MNISFTPVGDCEVIPVAAYEIRSIVVGKESSAAENYSVPLAVSTINRPGESYWADVAPPLGSVDIRDIAALVDCFKELPTALPLVVCDIVPDTPDKWFDSRDVSAGVDAFKPDCSRCSTSSSIPRCLFECPAGNAIYEVAELAQVDSYRPVWPRTDSETR